MLLSNCIIICSTMSHCQRYNPDNIFTNFKVIEFPISYVGLWTTQFLDLEIDLSKSAYLKTMCEGNLLVGNILRHFYSLHFYFITFFLVSRYSSIRHFDFRDLMMLGKFPHPIVLFSYIK